MKWCRFGGPLRPALASGLALLLASARADAHRNGIASEGCSGCHSGGTPATVAITAAPAMLSPGQMATFAVAITAPEGYAGLFMTADTGTLVSLAGQGTQLISGGITHTAPKKAVNGVTTFQIGWMAPAGLGGVSVNVYALAANGDNTPRGDGAGMGFEAFAVGCSGMMLYRDFDGDGYGAMTSGYTRSCGPEKGYAAMAGDCDDNDERIYPGAVEICNHRDDNCNGLIDEGLPTMTYYLVVGGGAPAGSPMMVTDCAPPAGYCARASCGTGWCRRIASSCDLNDCTPGAPIPETCNDFDDDCDGVVDNGTDLQLCGPTGLTCVQGMCVKPGTVIPDAGAGDASKAGGGNAASGGAEVMGSAGEGPFRRSEAVGCDVATGGSPSALAVALALALAGGSALRSRARRPARAKRQTKA
ncbi:MAG TPA: putative metal-binding motif-containing protein [Polyangia bacterium]|jgi:hypothetical protein|nr:putative metal-binding motif-containing protein [Polyangia bacterium]